MVTVEPIGQSTKVGEGPHWDEKEQVLYFVDIPNGTVNKYDPATKALTSVKVDSKGTPVSLVVPVEGKKDQFVITQGHTIAVMTWDGKSSTPTKVETISAVHDKEDERENRFNDGKVDRTGRFWAGTAGKISESWEAITKGCLFSFSKDWKSTVRLTDISMTNGMDWSPDMKTMYYIDSFDRNVKAFDLNGQTGELTNRRVAFDLVKNGMPDYYPDGMTVDTEGKLWIAIFGGGRVVRADPTSGKVLSTVRVPSPDTTSVAFGGPNLDELYITTGIVKVTEEDLKEYPYAGYTFRVTGVGAKGFPGQCAHLI